MRARSSVRRPPVRGGREFRIRNGPADWKPAIEERTRSLTLQFLAWLSERPRTYADAMQVWRTSCPRLSIWEDALADGLIKLENTSDRAAVTLTKLGRELLGERCPF